MAEEIEKGALELKAKLDSQEAEIKEWKEKVEKAEAKLKESEEKGNATEAEVKKLQEDVVKMNEGLNDLNKKMSKKSMETKATFVDALRSVYEGEVFKSQLNDVMSVSRAKTQVFGKHERC